MNDNKTLERADVIAALREEAERHPDVWLYRDAADLIEQLTAPQSENAEKDREIAKLKDVNVCQRRGLRQLRDELSRVEAERDAAHKEIERMKDIMRQHGIMVIPSKYPGGQSAWNIRRGAQGEG